MSRKPKQRQLIDQTPYWQGSFGLDFPTVRAWSRIVHDFHEEIVYGDRHDADTDACNWCGVTGDLVLDHCHGCGRIRGLLCRTCNAFEGKGRTVDGWASRCEGQHFYEGRSWSPADMSPQRCGAQDEYAVALRDWWKAERPDLFEEIG